MSYLNPLRLHFAGEFQANVSTVNNDPAHFDNAAFKPQYQQMEGRRMQPPNGWFNPQGDAAFRLLGCGVTAAFTPAGPVPEADPVLACRIADSDDAAPAKLVDLDSEQQLVSEIWGLTVRVSTPAGDTLLRGDFEPAAFIDIWDRATGQGGGGDTSAGAAYQSVLTNLTWGDVSASPFLTQLKAAAGGGRLSIKFNVDGLSMDFTSPKFMCGRIIGSIGPAGADEPDHLIVGRQFMAAANINPPPNFFRPDGQINFCVGQLHAPSGVLFLDLGNALSTATPGGSLNNLGDLTVSVSPPNAAPVTLGVIAAAGANGYAGDPTWYARTAGVAALPLSAAQLQQLAAAPLSISGPGSVQITEWSSGAFVRADRFVWRLSPGDQVDIPAYAMQWGKPLAGATIEFALDPSQLQPTTAIFPYVGDGPPVATPTDTLAFAATAVTDAKGVATLAVRAGDPGTPRWFNGGQDYGIDGQVYGVRPGFAAPGGLSGPLNQWNFVSFLVWSGFTPANPLTWTQIQPILQQYANLYPVMQRFLEMGDYDQAVANKELLRLAFGLDPADPNSMPVTRDLSPAKRAAILAWLDNPLPGPTRVSSRPAAQVAPAPASAAVDAAAARGGKAAAAARRLVLRAGQGDAR
ncbi:MAG TPA: hypothetical protein VGF50_02695 [Caulobacteraceae bacterium]